MGTLTGTNSPARPSLRKSLARVAAFTAAVLMIPLIAMQFTADVHWTGGDFVAAGILLFAAGLAVVAASRMARSTSQRLVLAGLVVLAFVYCWAELAVGIVTNLGS